MKRYEKYKPSGVEWIGEIPEHWDLERLKYEVHYEKGKNPKELTFNERGKVYLTMDYLRGNPKQTFYVEDFKNYLNVEENQILILWDGSNAGEFIRSKAGVLSSTMAALNLYNNNHGYAWYFFKTFERKLKETTIGMGVPHVNGEEFKNHIFIIPLREEQTAIANYLDEKTAQIDTLVANKQKLIELLKEERTAIINHAVTKGINPKAKLKPSGIEWLGDIPEHWEVKKLKYVAEARDDAIEDAEFKIAVENIENGTGKLINMEEDKNYQGTLSRFLKGDTIFNKLRPYLHKVYLAEKDGGLYGELLVIFPKGELLSEFLFYKLFSKSFIDIVDSSTYGTKMPRANWDDFIGHLLIAYPKDKKEQQAIVQHIESHTTRIDATISKIEKEIELMLEYRTALINEAVTGKIKVSNFD
ncbi:MAG: restriction endonuclease subunit S [Nitrospirota bacterium]